MASATGQQQFVKPQEFFKEVKQLDIRVQNLCKEKDVQLYKRSPHLYSELSEMDKKLAQDFLADRLRTIKEVHRLKQMVQRFHEELRNVQPTPEFLEKLKVIMEEIESNILAFKDDHKEKYEQIMESELQYSHEINALEKKFESWAESDDKRAVINKKPMSRLPSARDVIKDLPAEVAQFEKFLLETGGTRGGWDEYDHNTFLKYRVKFKGRAQFLSEVISRLPTKTSEEVNNHETWYREYIHLQELKKQAIRAWKDRKNAEKEEQLAEVEVDEDPEQKDSVQKHEVYDKERQARRQKLGVWKLQKELERAEAEEMRLRQEKDKAEKEQMERQRQQELRDKVVAYKRQKQEDEEQIELQRLSIQQHQERMERERRAENLERVELRNHYAEQQRVRQKKKAEREKAELEERQEKLKAQYQVPVARDPSRLLQPTAGWRSRTKEVGASSEAGRIYTMPHRAVPTWRQGL